MGATWSSPGVVLSPKDAIVSLYKFQTETVISACKKFLSHYPSINRITREMCDDILQDCDPDGSLFQKSKGSSLESSFSQIFSTFAHGEKAISIDAHEFFCFIIIVSFGPLEDKIKFLFKYFSGGFIPIENVFPDSDIPCEKTESSLELNRLSFYLLLVSLTRTAHHILYITPPSLLQLQQLANAVLYIPPPEKSDLTGPLILELPLATQVPLAITGAITPASLISLPNIDSGVINNKSGAALDGENSPVSPYLNHNPKLDLNTAGNGGVHSINNQVTTPHHIGAILSVGDSSPTNMLNNPIHSQMQQLCVELQDRNEPKWSVSHVLALLSKFKAPTTVGSGGGVQAENQSGNLADNPFGMVEGLLGGILENPEGDTLSDDVLQKNLMSNMHVALPDTLIPFTEVSNRFITCITRFTMVDKLKSRAEGLMESFRTVTHNPVNKKKMDIIAAQSAHAADPMDKAFEDESDEAGETDVLNAGIDVTNEDFLSSGMGFAAADALKNLQSFVVKKPSREAAAETSVTGANSNTMSLGNLGNGISAPNLSLLSQKKPPLLASLLPSEDSNTLNRLTQLRVEFKTPLGSNASSKESELIEPFIALKENYVIKFSFDEVKSMLAQAQVHDISAADLLDCQLRAIQRCSSEEVAFRTPDFQVDPFGIPPSLSHKEAMNFISSQENQMSDTTNQYLMAYKIEQDLLVRNSVLLHANVLMKNERRLSEISGTGSDLPILDQIGFPPEEDELLAIPQNELLMNGGGMDSQLNRVSENPRRQFEWLDLRAYFAAYLAVTSVDPERTGRMNASHFSVVRYVLNKLEKGMFSHVKTISDVLPASYSPAGNIPVSFLAVEIGASAVLFRRKRQERLISHLFHQRDPSHTGFILVGDYIDAVKEVSFSICQKYGSDVEQAARRVAAQLFVSYCLPYSVAQNGNRNKHFNNTSNSEVLYGVSARGVSYLHEQGVEYTSIRSRLNALSANEKFSMPFNHFRAAMLVLLRKSGLLKRMVK